MQLDATKVIQLIAATTFMLIMYGMVELIESYSRDEIMSKHDTACRDCSKIIEAMHERNRQRELAGTNE